MFKLLNYTNYLLLIILILTTKLYFLFDYITSNDSSINWIGKRSVKSIENFNKENEARILEIQNEFKEKTIAKCVTQDNRRNKIVFVPEDSCDSPFLTTADGGRLGNNICEYMSLLLLRKTFGIRIAGTNHLKQSLENIFEKVPLPSTDSKCFEPEKKSLNMKFHILQKKFLKETLESKRTNFSRVQPNSIVKKYNRITEYPCAYSQLLEFREEIVSELQIKKDVVQIAKQLLVNALQPKYNVSDIALVSIHVRRTDYIEQVKKNNNKMPTKEFYLSAIDFYKKRFKNSVFIVLSDDKIWAKENLKGSDIIFPGTSDIESPFVDFAMLTLCHHHIIGVGTFSKTSAFLGGGSIVSFFSNRERINITKVDVPALCHGNSKSLDI